MKGLAGDVDKNVFIARGSKQRYRLKPGGPHEKLGTSKATLSGKVTQEGKGEPEIEVLEAVEIK